MTEGRSANRAKPETFERASTITKLKNDGSNYLVWNAMVKNRLKKRDLMAVVDHEDTAFRTLSNSDVATALEILHDSLPIDLLQTHFAEDCPRRLWNQLETEFQQQKAILLPSALYRWTHLRVYDF